MKIIHYCYDNVNNPRCGGGGAFRELMIHKQLSARHEIFYYTGRFKGAKPHSDGTIHFDFLGCGANYLISRITFSVFATMHSLFVNADLIAVGYSVFSPVLGFLLRRDKTVLEFYHRTGVAPFRKYLVFGVFPWFAEHTALRFGKHFITLTDSMAEYIKNNYRNKNVCAAYTGYDSTMTTEKNSGDDNYILCFGRIDVHMKGLDILVDAFEKTAPLFPAYILKIAGRGSEKDVQWLENRINESPVKDRIRFLQNVSQSEKHSLFRSATFVCMPSRFEGWCISAIEAGACAKATIGTQIMGLKDSIKDNQTGILVPPQNADALAEKMNLLLTDKPLRKRLGDNGFVWAQNFTWEKVTKLQEDFYLGIVEKKISNSIPIKKKLF